MKKLLQYMLIFSLMLTIGEGILFSKSQSKSTVEFFAPGGLYVYAMGSYNHFAPSEDHYLALGSESSHAYAPLLGMGYRVVNINDRVFICLEGKYSRAAYDFGDLAGNQKISVLSFIVNAEGSISAKFPLLVFGGFGFGVHELSDLHDENVPGDYITGGDDTITILALDVGIKMPVSRHLVIRTEFQWNSESYRDYGKMDFLNSSSLSMGLEIHFKGKKRK